MEAYSPFPVSEKANMASSVEREPSDSLMIVFWNLENFFDYKDEGMSDSDKEFSEKGQRRWSKRRFFTKCRATAKALAQVA